MEHIVIEANDQLYQAGIWDFYFGGRSTCILDIETTGLDRARCHFVLGGLYDPEEGKLHQIFADHTKEEEEALTAFMDLANRYDVIVTYNGRHFDLPFLAERVRRTGCGAPACHGYDLDLYQVVNGHSPIRRLLPNLKQKTVESYMGLWQDRTDEISGAESVELYYHYMTTGDPQARREILLHNSDDVLQLTRLTKVIGKSDFHKAMYSMGFPAGEPSRRWQVRKIRTVRDKLVIEGSQGAAPMEYLGFAMDDYPLQTRFRAEDGTFRMELPIVRRSPVAAADLRAAGLDEKEFQKYPGFGSGFLVVEEGNEVKYREMNHLVKAVIRRFEQML